MSRCVKECNRKTVSGISTIYHYDIAGNLIAETTSGGTPSRDIVYMNGERVAMKLYDSQAGWYFFVNDHLGTPQKIVNESGQVVWAGFYQPFGKSWAYPADITNNFRFQGQYYDAETGLHYNWNRYYDPDTGRYITADPIGLEGGVNLYEYVRGNPVNLTDPPGLFSEPQKQQIITSWRNTGAVVGAFIGSLIGGSGGFLTGPGAAVAAPSGAYAGAGAGAVGGAVIAQILAKGVLHIMDAVDSSSCSKKPSKKECSTAIKILTQYERLAKKYGIKISQSRLRQLDVLRDKGMIKLTDIPAKLREKFPGTFSEDNLDDIYRKCG